MGVNLDLNHPNGFPRTAAAYEGMKLARLKIKWQRLYGARESISTVVSRYREAVDFLKALGITPILVIGHETGYEGFFNKNWENVTRQEWSVMIADMKTTLSPLLLAFSDCIIQIWNEPDRSFPGEVGRASVFLEPDVMGEMYSTLSLLILRPLFAGLKSGPGNATAYIRNSKVPLNRIWGIAIHEYGRGVPDFPKYRQFGLMQESINVWNAFGVPSSKLWLTEWGTLDVPNDSLSEIANYASKVTAVLQRNRLAGHCWYAIGEGMDNGRGYFRDGLINLALRNAVADSFVPGGGGTPVQPTGFPTEPNWVRVKLSTPVSLNFRSLPNGPVLTTLRKGARLALNRDNIKVVGQHRWIQAHNGEQLGWVAENISEFIVEF